MKKIILFVFAVMMAGTVRAQSFDFDCEKTISISISGNIFVGTLPNGGVKPVISSDFEDLEGYTYIDESQSIRSQSLNEDPGSLDWASTHSSSVGVGTPIDYEDIDGLVQDYYDWPYSYYRTRIIAKKGDESITSNWVYSTRISQNKFIDNHLTIDFNYVSGTTATVGHNITTGDTNLLPKYFRVRIWDADNLTFNEGVVDLTSADFHPTGNYEKVASSETILPAGEYKWRIVTAIYVTPATSSTPLQQHNTGGGIYKDFEILPLIIEYEGVIVTLQHSENGTTATLSVGADIPENHWLPRRFIVNIDEWNHVAGKFVHRWRFHSGKSYLKSKRFDKVIPPGRYISHLSLKYSGLNGAEDIIKTLPGVEFIVN